MYTGIVQAMVPVAALNRKPGLMSFKVQLPDDLAKGLESGASVAVNGVCFTVTQLEGREVAFDAMQQTLDLTNIDQLEEGSSVNIERSAAADAEVGGHLLSGHVMATARVLAIEDSPNNKRIWFQGNPDWMKYCFNKGFLALNGASLTIAELDREANKFAINLIPETLQRTNFSLLKEGDEVNVEVEHQTQIIVDTLSVMIREGQLTELIKAALAESDLS